MKNDWKEIIRVEKSKPYFKALSDEIAQQRAQENAIFPLEKDVFSAFDYVDISEVKVVILGQDPYHGIGKQGQPQAHGLAFSVNPDVKIPPSLVNIYKELNTDIESFIIPEHGHLIDWAEQGVLLLNTVLTVKQGQAHSHAKLGWETFTEVIIEAINQQNSACVFMLWGSHAQKKGKKIDTDKHFVLVGPHPSPLSAYRGFFGCQHFSKANQWLIEHDLMAIDWTINP
jgi:uracil-DNA glycosylase